MSTPIQKTPQQLAQAIQLYERKLEHTRGIAKKLQLLSVLAHTAEQVYPVSKEIFRNERIRVAVELMLYRKSLNPFLARIEAENTFIKGNI